MDGPPAAQPAAVRAGDRAVTGSSVRSSTTRSSRFSPTFMCQCPRALKVLVTATVVGLLTGFLGVGGGFLVVPALVLALALPMRYAAGTSLVVITITSAAALAARAGAGVAPDWRLVAALTTHRRRPAPSSAPGSPRAPTPPGCPQPSPGSSSPWRRTSPRRRCPPSSDPTPTTHPPPQGDPPCAERRDARPAARPPGPAAASTSGRSRPVSRPKDWCNGQHTAAEKEASGAGRGLLSRLFGR